MRISLFQGRFQPPTILHKQLIDDQVQLNDLTYILIVDGEKSSKDKEKNPFSFEERKRMINKINKSVEVLRVVHGYLPETIKYLYDKYGNRLDGIDFYCGTDRVNGYESQINRQSELTDEQKNQFKIHETKRTDADVSQSKLRVYLLNDDFKNQKQLIPKELYGSLNSIQKKYQERVKEYNIKKEQILYVRKLLI